MIMEAVETTSIELLHQLIQAINETNQEDQLLVPQATIHVK